MKKKGFTLIELLAVIIILAIVALVATPIIIDVIEDARNSAALSNANLVYTGINNYCYQSRTKAQISETADICEDGVTVEEVATMVNLNDIVIKEVEYDYDSTKITKSKLESNGKELELQEDGTFTIDGKAVADTTKPTLVATSEEVTVKQGEEHNTSDYFTATFGKSGGNVTCNPSNTKDLEVGTHTTTCKAVGTNGLESSAVTKEIIIVENKYTDASGANKPELYDGLTPIKYDGTNWVVADTTKEWYDYDAKEWANAAVLNSGVTKNVGDTVSESDIALWYVWIPRYKYQLFNAQNGSANEQLINVTFETGTTSTGTVTCKTTTSGNGTSSETCTNATIENWYTHPAFTFGTDELTGFWIGKFEISTTNSTCNENVSAANCNKISTVTIKPNVANWRYATVSNYFTSIQNIKTTYKLSNYDSHMIKNMEWGAVAYLKQSKYGLGVTDIGINNNSKYITGCGAASGSKESTSCNAYNTTNGMLASTTGNTYGVYDMSGGAWEYVMGNEVNESNKFCSSDAGFGTDPNDKYYDSYDFNTSRTTHGRGKLGDATKESLKTFGIEGGGWYSDHSTLPYWSSSWFSRGGCYFNTSGAGVFAFYNARGTATLTYSTRAVLVKAN